MGSEKYAVGIDLGGTFIKFALVAESGGIRYTDKLSIDSSSTRDDILETICQAIRPDVWERHLLFLRIAKNFEKQVNRFCKLKAFENQHKKIVRGLKLEIK